jgi:superfamily II DNA/RNA helicase
MDAFHSGKATTLVATDIAARGIHVDDVALVIHADPPAEHKAYLHRSGRTARAGAEGVVVTVSTPDERGDTRTLMRQAGIRPTATDVAPGHPAIAALTGPAADLVTPSAVAEPVDRPRGGSGSRDGSASRSGAGSRGGSGPRGAGKAQSSARGRRGGSSGGSRNGGSRSSGGGSAVVYQSSSSRSGGLADFSSGRRGR